MAKATVRAHKGLIKVRAALTLFAQIEALAENGIQHELDIPQLKAEELCPLRAIVDIAHRARQTLGYGG